MFEEVEFKSQPTNFTPFQVLTILIGPCFMTWAAMAFLNGVGVLGTDSAMERHNIGVRLLLQTIMQ